MSKLKQFAKFILIMTLMFPVQGQARDIPIKLETQRDVKAVMRKTQEFYADVKIKVQEIPQEKNNNFEVMATSVGNYDQYSDVETLSYAKIKYEAGKFKTLESQKTIYSKGKKEYLVRFIKTFDYEKNLINFQRIEKGNNITLNKDFSIEGPVCDDFTMVYFMKNFLNRSKNSKSGHFYLLSNEPKMYKIVSKYKGKEILKLPIGEVNTQKYQLMANFGPFTALASRFIPKTFVWFDENFPYEWLQYEGMDNGPNSRDIKSYVAK